MTDRIDIHINVSEVVGEAVARVLEQRGLAIIPRDTGLAAIAVGDAASGSPEEAAAVIALRALVERDRANAPTG